MIATVTPVFQTEPRWLVLLLFGLSVLALLRVLWFLFSELFWAVYDWWHWRKRC